MDNQITPENSRSPGGTQRHVGRRAMLLARLLLIAAFFWFFAPAGRGAPLISEVGQEISLGGNLNGEACQLRRTEAPKDKAGHQDYGLFCKGWTQPSGFLVTFPAGPGFNPSEILSKGSYAEQLALRLAQSRREQPSADRKDAPFCRANKPASDSPERYRAG
jgi:hypothetical protein